MIKVVGPSNHFDYFLNDPTTPSLITRVPLPKLSDIPEPLKMEVIGYREGPLVQEDATRIQAASVLYSLIFTLTWVNKIRKLEKWAATGNLKVSPRAGKQFNAYYDRYGLHFFYQVHPRTKKVVFTADSTEAINHEFGHAILDAFRPDFWDLSVFEISCFHEAFGDIISMLSSMHHEQILLHMLKETKSDLTKSNVVSRIAEEFGNALAEHEPTSGRPKFCLRDAAHAFQYVTPSILPEKSSYNTLCREVHNFSRIFSSAWYRIFVELYMSFDTTDRLVAVKNSRDIMAHLTILCLDKIEKRTDIYCAVAQAFMKTDLEHFGGQHIPILRKVFSIRNIIPAQVLY